MSYGLDINGNFTAATVEEIKAEIEASELADIDPDLDTSSDQAIGQLNGIFAKKTAECHELLDVAFGAFDESKCEGALLDALCALTGTKRDGDTQGLVKISCALTSGTALTTTATVAKSGDATNRWTLAEDFTAPSTGTFELTFKCEKTGPILAPAGTLTVIVTPVSGWSSATNATDATPGTNRELDPPLRIKRRAELAGNGGTTVAAERAQLLKVDGVKSAMVLENDTAGVVDGMPPHSSEALVWDGAVPAADNNKIFDVVYANKGTGIYSHGTTRTTKLDEYGVSHSIGFTRGEEMPVYVYLMLDYSDGGVPAAVRDAIVAAANSGLLGGDFGIDVVRQKLMAIVMGVSGVFDIAQCDIGVPSKGISVAAANIAIGLRQIATFDTGNIDIDIV